MSDKRQGLIGIPFTRVKIFDGFWSPRIDNHQESIIKACLDKCRETGRISNFDKAAGLTDGEFEGNYFNDSDVYKLVEGIAYSLFHNPNDRLEQETDGIIDRIAAAQQADGYLDTYFILTAPDKKWTDMEKHEDYCAGHLIEAAVEYYKATGKGKLLEVARKLADHIDNIFGEGKRHWVTGHQELELALVKLYHITNETCYLKLANWFLEERGHGYGKGVIWGKEEWGTRYCQDDKPIYEMSDVKGHAVRAMYLYTAVADVAAVTENQGYIDALNRLWDSVVNRNMYITGGIGSTKNNEGFTSDYDLPNSSAYCETCASVGMVYWNHRMNLLNGDSIYADILERSLYNGVLSGVSLDGGKFFYVNPLESDGSHHRQEWYDCSCCPTQIARFIPSVGNYIYAASDDTIYINLFISSEVEIPLEAGSVKLIQMTEYPWKGAVNITLKPQNAQKFAVKLRYPGWCKKVSIKLNNESLNDLPLSHGYLKIEKEWKDGDTITADFSMPAGIVHSDPRVAENTGKAALQRGPLVYCFEEADNIDTFHKLELHPDMEFTLDDASNLLSGATVIKTENGHEKYTAVPYYTWDNRKPGGMKVWIKENR